MSEQLIENIYLPVTERIAQMNSAERKKLASKVGRSEAAIRFIGARKTKFCSFDLAVSLFDEIFPNASIQVFKDKHTNDQEAA